MLNKENMKKLLYFMIVAGIVGLFATCTNQSPPQQAAEERAAHTEEYYLEQGSAIAAASFTALSGRLMAAIKQGGVSEAVQYCNVAGLPLMDSLSQAHEVSIRRTSLKVRQPKDMPTVAEKKALDQYHAQFAAGEVLKPFVENNTFYAPILVSEACLKCHGQLGETLKLEDYDLIKQLYPEDEAIGYVAGDLRGIWSITFAAKAPTQD